MKRFFWKSVRGTTLALAMVAALISQARAAVLPDLFTETPIITKGLPSPTSMAIAPDGRIFVCRQDGIVAVVKNGTLLSTPFVTVPSAVLGEQGLLGIALDPNFSANQQIYLHYTATNPVAYSRVSRFTAVGDVADPASEYVVVDIVHPGGPSNHSGGAIGFAPDGKLLMTIGYHKVTTYAQTLTNVYGKILRFNADGTIPTDNPFYNTATGVNRAIYAYGLRNPYTFAVQPGTGRIFINDVGQSTWEEIDELVAGANYGWPVCEGDCAPANGAMTSPLYRYLHGEGTEFGKAIVGGTFYNPAVSQFPNTFYGKYFFQDHVNGWIKTLDPAQGNAIALFATGLLNPVDLKVGPDGRLYYLQRKSYLGGTGGGIATGVIYAISYNGTMAPQITESPANTAVPEGRAATFRVGASGHYPLTYQWKRGSVNIPGANADTYTLEAVTLADSGAIFSCAVTNAYGNATSGSATLQVLVDQPPVPTISLPTAGSFYSGGEVISYTGLAVDPEEGALPASALSWTIVLHHDTHTHPFLGPLDGITGDSFTVPADGETATNTWVRIHLTATDSFGETQETYTDIYPRLVELQVATNPEGLEVYLDGQPQATPASVTSVVGIRRFLNAPAVQLHNGIAYHFDSWLDGGPLDRAVYPPEGGASYVANFRPNAAPVAVENTYAVGSAALVVGAPGVLANDSDLDGDPLQVVLQTGPTHGTLDLQPDGSFTYTPEPGYDGPDSFTYFATDTYANSGVATVQLIRNHAPVGSIDAPQTGALYAGGDVIPFAGSGIDSEDGALAAGAFTWWVSFHHDGIDEAVQGPLPGITSGSFSVPTDGPATVNTAYRVTLMVTDSAGLTHLSARDIAPRITQVNLGTVPSGLSLSLDQTLTPTPSTTPVVVGMNRAVAAPTPQTLNGVTYRFASWSDGGANGHTINPSESGLTLTATYQANQVPTAIPESYNPASGVAFNVAAPGVLGNDSDADGDALQATLVSGPSHGSVTLNPNGSFTYTSVAGYAGSDSFTYAATDGFNSSVPTTVGLTVGIVLAAPTGVLAADGTYTNKIRVVWAKVTGATHYRVYRAASPGGTKTALGTWTTATGYDDLTVNPGEVYYYCLQAAKSSTGAQAGLFSPEDPGWEALSPPSGVSATDGTSSGAVTITWNVAAGATHYRVYRANSPTLGKTAISTWQSGTSFVDTTGKRGVVYYYSVRAAVDAAGTRYSRDSDMDAGYR